MNAEKSINWDSLKVFKPNAQVIFSVSLASFFINVLSLIFPLVLLQVYDRIIPNAALNTFIILVLGVTSALLLESLLRVARTGVNAWESARQEHRLRKNLIKGILALPHKTFEKEGAGEHLEKITSLNSLKDFYSAQAAIIGFDIPFVLLFLTLITYLGGIVVIPTVISLIAIFFLAKHSGDYLRELLGKQQNFFDHRANFTIEVLQSIQTIKGISMERLILRRYERLQKSHAEQTYQLCQSTNDIVLWSSIISQINLVAVVSIGSILVINNSLTVGGLAACTLLANRTLQPVSRAVNIWKRLQAISVAEKRVTDLNQSIQQSDKNLEKFPTLNGKIEFRDVTIDGEDHQPLFQNLSLVIQPGEIIGIVGQGNSGKTTLLKAMAGMITPSNGTVAIDDNNLQTYDLTTLREQIAYLPQETCLFEGSILENITMFRGGQYQYKAKELCKKLIIDSYINHLPKGYETQVGSFTSDIIPSGIKQTICIARCLLDAPQIILFDEANSHIDIKTDKALKELLAQYCEQSTAVIVSHRPSFLKLANKIYEIHAGKLILQEQER